MHSRSTSRFRPLAGVVAALAIVAGSLLVASPASANPDVTLSGTETSGGNVVPLSNVILFKIVRGNWYALDSAYNVVDGAWTIEDSLGDGSYALFYQPDGTGTPYSTAQGWDGSLTYNVGDLMPQFTITNGVMAMTTDGEAVPTAFDQDLLVNAGAVTIQNIDSVTGVAPTGNPWTEAHIKDGLTADGTVLGEYINYNKYTDTDGNDQVAAGANVTVGQIPAGTFYGSYFNPDFYWPAYLPSVAVTVGKTTSIDQTMYSTSLPSAATLLDPASSKTTLALSADAKVGTPITVSGVSATSPAVARYQWYNASTGAPLPGETGSSYTPVAGDVGSAFTVRAYYEAAGYGAVALSSTTSDAVVAAPQTQSPFTVTVTGAHTVGSTLAATVAGTDVAASIALQWNRDGVPIPGATDTTYVTTGDDLGAAITATATSVLSGYTTASADSVGITVTAVPVVTSTPTPTPAPTVSAAPAPIAPAPIATEAAALPAKKLAVVASKAVVPSGSALKITASKLAAGEAFRVVIAGKTVARGTANASGAQSVRVVVPAKPGTHTVSVFGSAQTRVGRTRIRVVSAVKTLRISTSASSSAAPNTPVVIRVAGLAASEPVVVRFHGYRASPASAVATAAGTYSVTVSSGWSWGLKKISARGVNATRHGTSTIDVEAR